MTEPLKQVIQCHGDSNGEEWVVRLMCGDRCVASVGSLESNAAAREAGEFLRAGVMLGWSLMRHPSTEELDAGVDVLNSEMPGIVDLAPPPTKQELDYWRVHAILSAAWAQFVKTVLDEVPA